MAIVRNSEQVAPPAWSEQYIAQALARDTFDQRAVVLLPNCGWPGSECDLLVVERRLRIIDIEIKISRADLKADAKKEKWWHREWVAMGPVVKTAYGTHQSPIYNSTLKLWPRRVWKHYYALPAEIWKLDLLDSLPSKASGVIVLEHGRNQFGEPSAVPKIIRRATACKDAEPLTPEQAWQLARLANIRMWEAMRKLQGAAVNQERSLQIIEDLRQQAAAQEAAAHG